MFVSMYLRLNGLSLFHFLLGLDPTSVARVRPADAAAASREIPPPLPHTAGCAPAPRRSSDARRQSRVSAARTGHTRPALRCPVPSRPARCPVRNELRPDHAAANYAAAVTPPGNS